MRWRCHFQHCVKPIRSSCSIIQAHNVEGGSSREARSKSRAPPKQPETSRRPHENRGSATSVAVGRRLWCRLPACASEWDRMSAGWKPAPQTPWPRMICEVVPAAGWAENPNSGKRKRRDAETQRRRADLSVIANSCTPAAMANPNSGNCSSRVRMAGRKLRTQN